MIDRDYFFDSVRRNLFNDNLKQSQVNGINVILDEWERRKLDFEPWLAYMLATAYHETARTMQPIAEYGDDKYFTRNYDITGAYPARAQRMGNTQPGDGIKYRGRGFVQLTWHDNYEKMTELLGERFDADFVRDPDLVMNSDIACSIMFEGMLKEESGVGDFTGRCLEQFLRQGDLDFIGARYVINGQDHAIEIANYAAKFLRAITKE